MAFGGGTFTAQDKKLPGAYINFISAAAAVLNNFGRGVAAMGLMLDWGPDGEIFTVTKADFEKNAMKIFGHNHGADQLKGVRDIFRNAHTLRAYRLNGGGAKAANSFAEAKYSGTRGNAISTAVAVNADDAEKFDVLTYMDGLLVDSQTVASAAELKANDYCVFKADAQLAANAGLKMSGGADGSATVESHQSFIDLVQSHSFNVIGAASDESLDGAPQVNALYAAFTRRMRDELGVKFQCVLYRHAADYEGVINVQNAVKDAGWSAASLVYWIAGLEAGTAINAAATNTIYDGEFSIDTDLTQAELENYIDSGCLVMHRTNDDVRVLLDNNSLVTLTETKNSAFRKNQTIRVIDAAAMQIADIFNTKYLGNVANNASGRISLWSDVVKIFRDMERIGAIEEFDENGVTVEQGQERAAVVSRVDALAVSGAMEKLYLNVVLV